VLTPAGWVVAGGLTVGDVVVGVDGQPARVGSVHRLGHQAVHQLVIADGPTIMAASGQPWAVEVGKGAQRRLRILSAMDILRLRQRSITVRLVKTPPAEFRAQCARLPVHPYLLGVLLGDGCLSGKSVKLWTCGGEIRAFAEAALPEGCRILATPTVKASTTGWPIGGVRRGMGLTRCSMGCVS
jgi:phosphate starvation-inducible PhoH-like protein